MKEEQRLAEEEHVKFVDFMYENFGLEKNPGYCGIIIRPLMTSGSLSLKENLLQIHINKDCKSTEEIRFTTWHDSSHYLHYLTNPSEIENKIGDNIVLKETIADLGALIYLNEIENLSLENVKRFYPKFERDTSFIFALKIARSKPELLERLAKWGYNNIFKKS